MARPGPASWQRNVWALSLIVFTAFVGRVFWYASVEKLGAMRSSTMKRLIPFFAVMLGVGVLGERLTAGMVAGHRPRSACSLATTRRTGRRSRVQSPMRGA